MIKREMDKSVLKEDARQQDNITFDKSKEKPKQVKEAKLKIKIRFDYKGKQKQARFFWGGKNPHDAAHEAREQQVSMWRNIPIQGINVEKIDLGEIYQVYDEETEDNISYAPLELVISSDCLEDLLCFIVKEEFRRIDIIEPDSLSLASKEIEKLLFQINGQVRAQINQRLKEIK